MNPVVTYHRPLAMSRIPVPVPRPPPDINSQKPPPKPTRLEMLQAQYQQKILKEKEEKLILLYEENQQRALERTTRQRSGKGGRGFYNERRDVEGRGPNPPVKQHYQQSRKVGSANSNYVYSKTSAGKDRSNLLEPIEKLPTKAATSDPKPPPFVNKPKLARHHRRNSQRSMNDGRENSDLYGNILGPELKLDLHGVVDKEEPPPDLTKVKQLKQKQVNHQLNADETSKPEAMTEYQKWKLEQDQEREERLNKFNLEIQKKKRATIEYIDSDSEENNTQNHIPPSPPKSLERNIHKKRKMKEKALSRIRYLSESDDEPPLPNSSKYDEEMRMKEIQLTLMIQKQKEELELMKRQREEEEEELRRENKLRAKREEEQKKRLHWLEEAQRKDREMEELSLQSDPYQPARNAQRIIEEANYHNEPSPPPQTPPTNKRNRRSVKNQNPVKPQAELHESVPPTVQYAQDEIEDFVELNLLPCRICGRKFSDERLAKHLKICKVASKKNRKVYDPVKMRTEGTEQEKYIRQTNRQTPQLKKSNWKENHKNFIDAIRYAKKVSEVEANGGNLADLPPPPVTENSDYVKCPWCTRKFAPATAERHIPKCKETKARPAPPKRHR